MSFIPVNTPDLTGNEKKYLNECIDTNWISSEGPFVNKFEKLFSSYIGVKYGCAVSSGTAALDIAIDYLNLKKQDEVIVPSFTIISVVMQIIRSGAKPVFADCSPETFNITLSEVERLVTSNTKAIVLVHTYGHPVDFDPIYDFCKNKNILVIEDSAEMHGQMYKNRMCGSLGDLSIFSFYPNKHITTGEGGMILTNLNEIHNHSTSARNLCFSDKRYIHHRIGWNYRMTNLQAAIGCAQLERIDSFIKKKREIGSLYRESFKNIDEIQMIPRLTSYSESIDWVFCLKLKTKELRENLMKYLDMKKIGFRTFFYPLHLQPIIESYYGKFESLPVSEELSNTGLYIPSGLGLCKSDQIRVIETITNFFK